ncbi:50S ribosomal protein L24e [Candidatus Woesearchaeota archaeon]|nr:50S ribosomal protein L24e [Candidatus Woesearchaeota archaeon]
MVKCSFCEKDIEKGTGKMFIKNDGKVLYFCKLKCEKNMLRLKRKAREQKWTETAKAEKDVAKETAKKAEKPKK